MLLIKQNSSFPSNFTSFHCRYCYRFTFVLLSSAHIFHTFNQNQIDMSSTSHYITTPTVFGVTIKKILAIFEVLKLVTLKVQVFWYVTFCRNANSSLGNYSHYDRASHPTRQDSSEIIPAR